MRGLRGLSSPCEKSPGGCVRSCLQHIAVNFIVTLTAIGFLEGFLQRDPNVLLPHGYAIAAICWSCPRELFYEQGRDDRSYSEWLAMKTPDVGEKRTRYLLVEHSRTLEYESETVWRATALEKQAQPGDMAARLKDVTMFHADGSYAIGKSQDGWFLLNLLTHELSVTNSKPAWSTLVENRTGLNPRHLRNPKSPFQQTRKPFVPWLYLALACYSLLRTVQQCRGATKEIRNRSP